MDINLFAVRVVGDPCWFYFNLYEDAECFMRACAQEGAVSNAFKRNELGQYEWITSCGPDQGGSGMNTRFTYFCKPGRFLSPREHFLYIGDWIRPEGYIVLQHGNLSYLEHKKISEQGFVRIFENRGFDYTYIETIVERPDLQRYRDQVRWKVGILTRKSYNLYMGHIRMYGRVV